jgi:type IV secretion system protein VirB9
MRLGWLLALALAGPVAAEVSPQAGAGDPHIQSVTYDPAQVVGLHVAPGYAVTVQLSPDERVETVTLGDAGGWAVQTNKRGDALIVKPLGGAGNTNLTVITDARVYNFALYSGFGAYGVQPYLVSFAYAAAAPVAAVPVAEGLYQLSGTKALWPVEMSDDGAFTRIRWAAGAAMPAVYRKESWGRRALVNGVVRDGAYVIEGVFGSLAFVLGGDVATAKRRKPVVEARP